MSPRRESCARSARALTPEFNATSELCCAACSSAAIPTLTPRAIQTICHTE
jgi:hypothetical protein